MRFFIYILSAIVVATAHGEEVKALPKAGAEAPVPPQALPEESGEQEESQAGVGGKRDLGILQGIIEDYDYRGVDKRDPFAIYSGIKKVQPGVKLGPVTQLERFDLEQLRLVAIMWNVAKPKALVVDPENNNYIVFKKTRVGRRNGYVAEIREGEMIIMETIERDGQVTYQPRVIRLQRE